MTVFAPIDICIATYRRPLTLLNLLDSLTAQHLDGLLLRIIVIDNDYTQSARQTVEAFRARGSEYPVQEVIYDVEPQQNIALARNRALRHTKGGYVAFVDDDETVSRGWLRALLATLQRYDADVVFGPVLSVLPSPAPAWAQRCFNRPRHATGTPIPHYGAGNVLLRRHVVVNDGYWFDAAFGLTGGEDTDFFHRLHRAGRRMVWCDEAVASEPVPAARLTLDWIRKRGFSGGQNYARVFVMPYSRPRKCVWFVSKLAQLTAGLLLTPVLRYIAYPSYVALTVKLSATIGQLAVCFSKGYFEEYRARRTS